MSVEVLHRAITGTVPTTAWTVIGTVASGRRWVVERVAGWNSGALFEVMEFGIRNPIGPVNLPLGTLTIVPTSNSNTARFPFVIGDAGFTILAARLTLGVPGAVGEIVARVLEYEDD